MSTEDPQQEDAFGLFRLGYSAFAWVSLVGGVFLMAWMVVILVENTPDGTAASRAYNAVVPTLTAIAADAPADAAGDDAGFNASAAMDVFTEQGCAACHTIEGDAELTCPNLTNIGTVAAERIAASDYTGDASDAVGYIEESIVAPNAHLVQDPDRPTWVVAGNSLMPNTFADALDEAELENLVLWLADKR